MRELYTLSQLMQKRALGSISFGSLTTTVEDDWEQNGLTLYAVLRTLTLVPTALSETKGEDKGFGKFERLED